MSIWASIDGPGVVALDGHTEAANYRAEGDPSIFIDVATTGLHNHVRLALWKAGGPLDVCALLAPDAARALRDRLTKALGDQP